MDVFRLDGRTAIVTGGSGGLGLGIAEALGERGANLVVCDLHAEAVDGAVLHLGRLGYFVAGTVCDITEPKSFSRVLDLAEESFGGADCLINNAGVTKMQDIFDVTLTDFDDIFNVNVKGLFGCTMQFVKRCVQRKAHANIVNLSSNGAKHTYDEQVHYCASKAAVMNMTQCMASSLARYDVNVNAVCPGAVDTAMLRACMAATEVQSHGKVTVADCEATWGPPQLGRLIQPVEVGRIIAFLCSDAGAMIRGQAINVDAGNTNF